MSHEFLFSDIAGRRAALYISDQGDRCIVKWGDLTILDASGEIGFWETFAGEGLKGAAYAASLKSHARWFIESEIYETMRDVAVRRTRWAAALTR